MPKKTSPKIYAPPPEYLAGCAPEQALCYDFMLDTMLAGYHVYPEFPSSKFDLFLVAEEGVSTWGIAPGTQIGIQAKMGLNVEVVGQLLEATRNPTWGGPDYVAALVPRRPETENEKVLAEVVKQLGYGLFYIYEHFEGHDGRNRRRPANLLHPQYFGKKWNFTKRVPLPEIYLWTEPGVRGPVPFVTPWRVDSVRRCMTVEVMNGVTRKQFQEMKPKLSITRWIDEEWIIPSGRKEGRGQIYIMNPESITRPDRQYPDVRKELERLNEARARQEEGEQAEAREVGEGPLREG